MLPQFEALSEVRGDGEVLCGLVEDVLRNGDSSRRGGVLGGPAPTAPATRTANTSRGGEG